MHFFRKRRAKSYQRWLEKELTLQEERYIARYKDTVSPEGKARICLHQTGFKRHFSRYYHCTLTDDFPYYLTETPTSADVVVFINTIDRSVVSPGQKVILFFHEPSAYAHLYQSRLDDEFAERHRLDVVTHLPTQALFIQANNQGKLHRGLPYVHFHHNADRMIVLAGPLQEEPRDKLICSITSGFNNGVPGYEDRKQFIEAITHRNKRFDLYGRYSKSAGQIKSFRGPCLSKWHTLRQYKFNLVIENSLEDWYISEKLFDSLICGCFPIYHGSEKVFEILPKDTFYYLPKLNSDSLGDLASFLSEHDRGIRPTVDAKYIYEHFSFYKALDRLLRGSLVTV
jgi:hypothetical protein